MTDGCLAPLHGEGRSATADPGGVWWEGKGLPHPGSLEGSPSLPTRGWEKQEPNQFRGTVNTTGIKSQRNGPDEEGRFGL